MDGPLDQTDGLEDENLDFSQIKVWAADSDVVFDVSDVLSVVFDVIDVSAVTTFSGVVLDAIDVSGVVFDSPD